MKWNEQKDSSKDDLSTIIIVFSSSLLILKVLPCSQYVYAPWTHLIFPVSPQWSQR